MLLVRTLRYRGIARPRRRLSTDSAGSSGSHSSRRWARREVERGIVRRNPSGAERMASRPVRGPLTTDEGQKLRLALRLAGVTQARAAKVLDARQTQLSAWMALGKGPDDVLQRLETAFGFQTDALVEICPGGGSNVLCHRYKPRGTDSCAACAMRVLSANVLVTDGDGNTEERIPTCVSCGKSEADQVRLRPARMLSGGARLPIGSASASAVYICTQCRNAHRHQLLRCPDCDGWMRAGRDRCHRCSLRS
jgi:hypothetical protein